MSPKLKHRCPRPVRVGPGVLNDPMGQRGHRSLDPAMTVENKENKENAGESEPPLPNMEVRALEVSKVVQAAQPRLLPSFPRCLI